MKNFILVFIIISVLFADCLLSQETGETEKYSQVRIFATSENDFNKIRTAGLYLDGGIYKQGLYFETWLSETEIELLKKSGVSYQITIPDWMDYYNNLPKMSPLEIQKAMEQSIRDYSVSHSIYGTMGGHLKWEEAISKLDSLKTEYPLYVSNKFTIGNSYENRPIWTVRITKNPDAPSGKPEVWYNALTHAREPVGMSNLFYFIYWLLENNNIDPIATYILNNREIYFTPCLNPDGYVYNQTTNPNGGGMWRKNRKPYGSYYGADLNRNFGTYNFWNSTNNGSSTSSSSDTYRGPSPFSEPETQVFRDFVNSVNFKVALDYHTYGNYLIKPYAWCDPVPTPHDYIYNEYGTDITAVNGYKFGTPYQTVNYFVRGGDLDWCYSSDSTGHARNIFAMTPEVGTAGFWPSQSLILPQVQSCLFMNKYYALVAGAYTSLKSSLFNKETYTPGETGSVKIVVKNKGRSDAQNIKVELLPASECLTIPVQTHSISYLPVFASDSNVFGFSIASFCRNNTVLNARLRIKQNDSLIVYDELLNIFIGTGYAVLADSAENGTSNWQTMTNWAIVTNKYLSPSHSFKGSCFSYTVSQMESVPLNVSAYPEVYLSFYHKHALEAGYDYGFLDVSGDNGNTWIRIATYNGIDSSVWKFQQFNITDYVGGSANMLVRFRDSCDGSVNLDGWYVDNIKITAYKSAPLSLNLKVYLEGFWNGTEHTGDTIKIFLANSSAPFAKIDSQAVVLSSYGSADVIFPDAPEGTYYIVIKHRNHLETWSSFSQTFSTDAPVSYDFTTTQTKAYGNNLIYSNGAWCIFGGDINQDGFVDGTDMAILDNDLFNYISGYVPADINGDLFVDGTDMAILDNNLFNYIAAIRPNGKDKFKYNIIFKTGVENNSKSRKSKEEDKSTRFNK